jgi:hypothetical protein
MPSTASVAGCCSISQHNDLPPLEEFSLLSYRMPPLRGITRRYWIEASGREGPKGSGRDLIFDRVGRASDTSVELSFCGLALTYSDLVVATAGGVNMARRPRRFSQSKAGE